MIFDFLNACFVSNLGSDDEVIWLLVDGLLHLVVRWQSRWYRVSEEGVGRREGEEGSSHQVCPLYTYVLYPVVSSDPLTGSGNISLGVEGKWK